MNAKAQCDCVFTCACAVASTSAPPCEHSGLCAPTITLLAAWLRVCLLKLCFYALVAVYPDMCIRHKWVCLFLFTISWALNKTQIRTLHPPISDIYKNLAHHSAQVHPPLLHLATHRARYTQDCKKRPQVRSLALP